MHANRETCGFAALLGRLFLEKPMPYSLAATCVELVAELRGPAPEPAAKALTALVRTDKQHGSGESTLTHPSVRP